jgi:hypothetical protein
MTVYRSHITLKPLLAHDTAMVVVLLYFSHHRRPAQQTLCVVGRCMMRACGARTTINFYYKQFS